MTYILFVLLLTSNNPVQLKSQEFSSEMQCLQAISKLIELENSNSKIKAICVRK